MAYETRTAVIRVRHTQYIESTIMAKRCLIEREKKRLHLVQKYKFKRSELKEALRKNTSFKNKLKISFKLQDLPPNSAPNRIKNRCVQTGRSHGYYRDFGLCRNALREMANEGLLPGVTKSSW